MNSFNEKGQIAAYDALIALTLFMLLFFALDNIWNSKIENIKAIGMQNDMEFRAAQAMAVLQTIGVPFNWEKNPADANAIGLFGKNKSAQKDKLAAFASLDYNVAQFLLKAAPYDFRFEFDATGTADDVNVGIGIDENKTVVAIERAFSFNGGNAIARLKIFK